MPLNGRLRPHIGPLYFNVSWRGWGHWPRITSWGVRSGRVTHNVTNDQTSVDLPGPVNWRSRRGRRNR
jgi:hypothetical protein